MTHLNETAPTEGTVEAAEKTTHAGSIAQAAVGVQAPLSVLSPEEQQHIGSEQSRALALAQSLVVDSGESEQIAWDIINRLGDLKKRIEADFEGAKGLSYKAWKAVCAQEKGHLDKLQAIDLVVRPKLGAWESEKRQRQAEELRIARERAEAAAMEVLRVEKEKLLAAAVEFEEAGGDAATVTEILELPIVTQPVEHAFDTARPAPKVAGAGAMVERWKYEIIAEIALPREYLMVDTAKLGKIVAAMKGSTNIPGVRVYSVFEPHRAGRANL
jgi:hypothetical protein